MEPPERATGPQAAVRAGSWIRMAKSLHSGTAEVGDFEDAYIAWRNQPFPPGSADDALDELHADLALADTWVAGSVIPYVERGLFQPAHLDVIEELGKLRNRAVELRTRRGEESPSLPDSYRDYADLLLRVYEGFLAQARREP
jgi:hypothetical protein